MWRLQFSWLNTNTNICGSTFVSEYKYKYIWVVLFWRICIRIYSDFHFFDKYKYIWVYQKWANMNTNMIIRTDIANTNTNTNIITPVFFYGFKSYKSMQIMHICAIIYHLWYLAHNNFFFKY